MPHAPLPPIMIYGQPCLREICKAVPTNYPLEALQSQIETLIAVRASTGAYSVSAPQIGWQHSVFVALLSEGLQVFINPVIHNPTKDDTPFVQDGCISIPGYSGPNLVPRFRTIYLSYSHIVSTGTSLVLDHVTDKPFTYDIDNDGTNRDSYVIQHEIDHLNGILFTDHLDNQLVQGSLDYDHGLSNLNSTMLNSIATGSYSVTYNTLNRNQA